MRPVPSTLRYPGFSTRAGLKLGLFHLQKSLGEGDIAKQFQTLKECIQKAMLYIQYSHGIQKASTYLL